MLRIILWSSEENVQRAKELAKEVSQELNILPLALTEAEALAEVTSISERERSGDSSLLFVNANLPFDITQIAEAVESNEKFSGDLATFTIDLGNTLVSSPEVTSETIIQSISSAQTWNLGCLIAKEQLFEGIGLCESIPQALLKISLKALGEHIFIFIYSHLIIRSIIIFLRL